MTEIRRATMIATLLCAVAALLLLSAPPAAAQVGDQQATGWLAAGGLVGGAAGLVAGGYAGAITGSNSCQDDDGTGCLAGLLLGVVIGGSIGEALGLPLGVHLTNGRRGSYVPAALASLGIAAAGLLALSFAPDPPASTAIFVTVPVTQLFATIGIERKTAERDDAE